MISNIKYILIGLILLPNLGMAQTELSLAECRRLAIENSEDIKIAAYKITMAKAEKHAAFTNYLPNFSGSATMLYTNKTYETDLYLPTVTPDLTTGKMIPNVMMGPGDMGPILDADGNPVFNMYAWLPVELSLSGAYMAGINVEQPLFAGGKIIAGNNMAKIGLDMAGDNLALQQMNLIAEADQAYWIHVSVKEKVKLVQKSIEMLEKVVQTVENGYKAGMLNRNELLKAQVRYNKATLDLQKVKSGFELTRMSLCRITGLSYDTQINVTDTVIGFSTELLEQTGNKEVTNRPEYRLLEKSIAFEDENIKMKRGNFLPTAGVSAGYSYIGGIEFSGSGIETNGFNVMGSIKIPVFHWGEGQKKIESAKIQRDIKTLELEKNTKLMMLEIEQARLNLQDAFTRIEITQMSLKQSDENLRVSADNYEMGMELMTDLLIAQAQWQQAYAELIDAKTDFKLKETAYLKAMGILKTE